MAKDRSQRDDYTTPLRRLLLGIVILCLLGIFLVWRIDSPRVERFRAQVVDTVVPSMDWAMVPVTAAVNLVRDFQSVIGKEARHVRQALVDRGSRFQRVGVGLGIERHVHRGVAVEVADKGIVGLPELYSRNITQV